MKKLAILMLAFILVLTAMVGCAQQAPAETPPADTPAATTESEGARTTAVAVASAIEATGEPRMVEPREDALDGIPLIQPGDFTEEQMPGLSSPLGMKPLKKFKVAFSNGDMGNNWRAEFFNNFIETGTYLKEQFGIDFIYANSGNDNAKQLQDIQSLLAQKPDLLLMSPNDSAPLTAVFDMCKEQGIPFFTIDRSIEAQFGTEMYICNIEGDNVACGVSMGMAVVEELTKKYGEPKGTVGEIAGQVGSSPAIHRAAGARMLLREFPNIQIVQSIDGKFEQAASNQAARDIYTAHPDLDAMINGNDASAMQAVEVAEAMGIKDVIVCGVDGDTVFLRDYIGKGRAVHSAEYPPYFAITSWEYAIHYLNGEAVPAIVLVPEREFMMNFPDRVTKMEEIFKYTLENNNAFVPAALGGYDVLQMGRYDPALWKKVYPVNWAVGGGLEYLSKLIPANPYELLHV